MYIVNYSINEYDLISRLFDIFFCVRAYYAGSAKFHTIYGSIGLHTRSILMTPHDDYYYNIKIVGRKTIIIDSINFWHEFEESKFTLQLPPPPPPPPPPHTPLSYSGHGDRVIE